MVRWRKVRWVLLGLILAACGLGGSWAYRVARSFSTTGGGITAVWRGIANPRSLFPGRDRLTILVLGRDYDRDRRGMPHSKHSRADTIMLLALDLNERRINAVSIPRDTKVTAPDGIEGKINAVLSRGGVDLMCQTLGLEFSIAPDYYVLLKPDAVRSIVDALGGVEIETLDEMHYDDKWGNLHIHLPKGRFVANGEQAEGYVRFRQPSRPGKNLEEGDLRRTARQQNLINAMFGAAMTPKNLWRADKIIETGFGKIETDLERTQVLALATIMKEAKNAEMHSATVPGEDVLVDGIYYYVLDGPRAIKMVDWLVRGNPFSGRNVARVSVYNASQVPGVARTVAAMLYNQGYDSHSAGNARDKYAATEVVFRKSLYEGYAREIASLVGATKVRKDPGDPRKTWGPDIFIYLAPDLAQSLQERYAPLVGLAH